MAQSNTKRTTVNAIMRSTAFRAGMMDWLQDEPFPKQYDCQSKRDAFLYEFGRLYAAASRETTIVLTKGVVSMRQQMQFDQYLKDGTII